MRPLPGCGSTGWTGLDKPYAVSATGARRPLRCTAVVVDRTGKRHTVKAGLRISVGPLLRLPDWRSSGVRGAFRGRTAAGRMCGAVETQGSELVLTDFGERICAPASRAEALAEAFLRIPLYKALYDRYAADGGSVPDSATIEGDMIRLGVSDSRIGIIRRAFLRSAEVAGYFRSGPDRLIRPSGAGGTLSVMTSFPPAPEEPAAQHAPPRVPIAEHPMYKALTDELPPVGSALSAKELDRWINIARINLRHIYRLDDPDESEQVPRSPNGASSR
jgi:hypothetical protein